MPLARERRVAVVTGASSGIGAAIARAFATRGWKCVLLARREELLRTLAEEIDGEYELCDVGDREAVEQIASSVLERHPRLGLLVNNAGIPSRGNFIQSDPEPIEEVMRVNYFGSVWSLRAFLPGLEADAPSHVVNVVSIAGTVSVPSAGPYNASKHAQLERRGVHVHTVHPGLVETEGFPQRRRFGSPLLRRLVVEPERVAERVVGAVERNRRESYVPSWYRPAALAQAAAPALVTRALAARNARRKQH